MICCMPWISQESPKLYGKIAQKSKNDPYNRKKWNFKKMSEVLNFLWQSSTQHLSWDIYTRPIFSCKWLVSSEHTHLCLSSMVSGRGNTACPPLICLLRIQEWVSLPYFWIVSRRFNWVILPRTSQEERPSQDAYQEVCPRHHRRQCWHSSFHNNGRG